MVRSTSVGSEYWPTALFRPKITNLTKCDKISYYDLMSSGRSADKRMGVNEATKMAKEMLSKDPSCLIIREHCKNRMLERGMNYRDVLNTLLGGRCTGIEAHDRSGLDVYRFETMNYRVECNIFKTKNIVAITAIKKRR